MSQHLIRRGLSFVGTEFPQHNDIQSFFKIQTLTWARQAAPFVGAAGWNGKLFATAHGMPDYACDKFVTEPKSFQAELIRMAALSREWGAVASAVGCHQTDCKSMEAVLDATRGGRAKALSTMLSGAHKLLNYDNSYAMRSALLMCNLLPVNKISKVGRQKPCLRLNVCALEHCEGVRT